MQPANPIEILVSPPSDNLYPNNRAVAVMTASGHQRSSRLRNPTSALPPMNGHRQTARDVRVIRCDFDAMATFQQREARDSWAQADSAPCVLLVRGPQDEKLTGFHSDFSEAPADVSNRGRTLLGIARFARWSAQSQDSSFKELWGP